MKIYNFGDLQEIYDDLKDGKLEKGDIIKINIIPSVKHINLSTDMSNFGIKVKIEELLIESSYSHMTLAQKQRLRQRKEELDDWLYSHKEKNLNENWEKDL